jgi:hypothetical protein
MKKRVERREILDYVTYGEQREAIRARVLESKRLRRIDVGPVLTFLFENAETVRYQVMEMVRAERLVKEAEIEHELETYNEILGGPGELGCTLLIGIADPAERDLKLRRWLELPTQVYLLLEDGTKVRARHDPRQVDPDRLSAVHYLKFDTQGRVPVAVGAEHPEAGGETRLSPEQRAALGADLA